MAVLPRQFLGIQAGLGGPRDPRELVAVIQIYPFPRHKYQHGEDALIFAAKQADTARA